MIEFRQSALLTFTEHFRVKNNLHEADEGCILCGRFYEPREQEVGVRVPSRSSSRGSGGSVGQYESRLSCQTLPCFSSGEYKSHTVRALFSLMPPQLCGQLWTVARGDQGRGCWQPIKAKREVLPVHVVSATAAARAASVQTRARMAGRATTLGLI